MKFYIEPAPLTGLSDVMDIQAIGRWGDNKVVVDAETQDEATKKLLDLLAKRVGEGRIRPATEDEAKEFEERQWESYAIHEDAIRIHEKCAKGLGNEQANQT
jgi:hypothetical protein